MKTIQIWPKEIEGGDAVAGKVSVQYLRFTDPEDGLEVVVMLNPEVAADVLTTIRTGIERQGKPH